MRIKGERYKMQLAIFDMDGLIFDSERMFMKKLDKSMSERGYTLTLEIYLSMLGANDSACMEAMKKHYGQDYPYREISDAARAEFNHDARKNGIPVKTGIPELLKFCKENEIKCAVASSTAAEYVKEYLKISGLDEYFDVIIGGDMVSRSKPAPDIFLKACETAGINPSEAVVFEDSENGIKAAVNGGIPVIWIPDMKRHGKAIVDLCAATAADGFEAIEKIKELM